MQALQGRRPAACHARPGFSAAGSLRAPPLAPPRPLAPARVIVVAQAGCPARARGGEGRAARKPAPARAVTARAGRVPDSLGSYMPFDLDVAGSLLDKVRTPPVLPQNLQF